MDEQSVRQWFVSRGDRFDVDLPVAAERRPAFDSLTGELVDYRLDGYSKQLLRPPAVASGVQKGSTPPPFIAYTTTHRISCVSLEPKVSSVVSRKDVL